MSLIDIPVASDVFLQRLRADLASAELCRFSVAYISSDGLDAIGERTLARVLSHPKSFGVSSLTCACGYEPLYGLQERIGAAVPRLKYFMEPMVPDPHDRHQLRLLHSKLIYLAQPSAGKAVIYIGSHNWSARALGPAAPRNAEASFRLEQQFVAEDLEGTGSSLGAAVNAHLLNCFNLPLCLPADASNVDKFIEWTENVCNNRQRGERLEERTIVLAVHSGGGTTSEGADLDWTNLQGRSIYAQILDEADGQMIPDRGRQMFVLLWDSNAALTSGAPPTLLVCHVSTSNAGPDSSIAGTNQSANPVSGFAAVILDREELRARIEGGRPQRRAPLRLRSGLVVNAFDFEFPATSSDARVIDGGTRPTYQFNLEVDHVVLPAERAADQFASVLKRLVWSPESFTVADKQRVPLIKSPGFHVDPATELEMERCMREVFHVSPDQAEVRPYSEKKDPKVGLRVSDHPLHDLLTGRQRESPEVFYEKLRGQLARIVPARDEEGDALRRQGSRIQRVQRVYARPLRTLMQEWQS